MVLPVSSPQKNPKSGVYYFREKVPADLRQAFGRSEVSRTLGTKNPAEAKARHAEEKRKQAMIWQTMRAKPEPLPHKTVMALAGSYYREKVAGHEVNPGDPEEWYVMGDVVVDAAENVSLAERLHGEDADRLLREAGLATDSESRKRLINAMNVAYYQAVQALKRMATGDYRPDPQADRFPDPPKPLVKEAAPRSAETVTLSDLFELWKADHVLGGGSAKTVQDFRRCLDSLTEFLEHEDAQRVTPRNVSDWAEHLRHDKGMSPKTVAGKYLVAVKRVFTVGKKKFRIEENPAAEVSVEVRKAKRLRSPGFTDGEAKAILRASLLPPEALGKMTEDNKKAIRWAPWLSAYTGARITELMQLRKQDVETHHGIACLHITPEAGSVKTGNARLVPLHPHLIDLGFLEFVNTRPEGYLFFKLKAGDDPVKRAGNVGKKVSDWVRETVGIKDDRIQPTHGWRHRFKTVAREVGIPPENIDAIQGHEDGRASTDYGDFTVKLLAKEIAKLPQYDLGLGG